jgi:Protein of unknown function (DUF2769)
MNQAMGTKVSFSATNVGKCLCPKCPVQSKSKCVSGKLGTIADALAKNPLNREDIPGLYCSTGNATCQDIDPTQACLCGGCAVFAENNLATGKPVGYYCRDGFAK